MLWPLRPVYSSIPQNTSSFCELRLLPLAMAFQSQLDQAVDQLLVRNPLAFQSLGYIEMLVKPGMVLISLR